MVLGSAEVQGWRWGPRGCQDGQVPRVWVLQGGCSGTPSPFPAWGPWGLAARLCSASSGATALPKPRAGFRGWGPIRADPRIRPLAPPGVTCLLRKVEVGDSTPDSCQQEPPWFRGAGVPGLPPPAHLHPARLFIEWGQLAGGGGMQRPQGAQAPAPLALRFPAWVQLQLPRALHNPVWGGLVLGVLPGMGGGMACGTLVGMGGTAWEALGGVGGTAWGTRHG